jgi:hypothetical protein
LVAVLATCAMSAPAAASTSRSDPGATRPVALVQAANSKTSCVYVPLGAPLQRVERLTGVDFNCLETFGTTTTDWANWESPWVTNAQYGYSSWVAASPTTRTLVLTLNLVPDNVAKTPNWRALGAAGRFNSHARVLARNLVAAGLGDSVIRLGPEMNGPWEVDWIGTTPAQWRQWAVYFGRIVRTMRSVPGAHFLFDWNVNANYEDLPLAGYYPGNSVVDIVGVDAYDEASIKLPSVGSPLRFSTLLSEPLGLAEVYRFAVQHHKPLSIPEWGTLSTNGDDGPYVAGIGHFVGTHDVAYECWFDAGHNNILTLDPAQAPKSFAAYRAYFGPASTIARYQRARAA